MVIVTACPNCGKPTVDGFWLSWCSNHKQCRWVGPRASNQGFMQFEHDEETTDD